MRHIAGPPRDAHGLQRRGVRPDVQRRPVEAASFSQQLNLAYKGRLGFRQALEQASGEAVRDAIRRGAATAGRGESSWNAPGAIGIRPGWDARSRTRSQRRPVWFARLPGRRRTASTPDTGHSPRNGKLATVAITAIARELSGFIWAISRAIGTAPVVAS